MNISDLPPETLDAVAAALNAADFARAEALSARALESGHRHPLLFNVAAFGEERRGNLAQALRHLAQAERLAPDDATIVTAIGNCLTKAGRPELARDAFHRAIVLAPSHAPAHQGLGVALTALRETESAVASHRMAAALAPNYPDPHGSLAEYSLRDKDMAAALGHAEAALALDPLQPSATVVMATLERADGKPGAALRRLLKLRADGQLTPLHKATSERLIADLMDAEGRTGEAFAAYEAANKAIWQIYGPDIQRSGGETGRALCRRLLASFATASPSDWTAAPGNAAMPARGHVFLVGFVRSGTTLLEQVLASHPDIVALEEMPTLRAIAAPYLTEPEGLVRLAALGAQEADALRAEYWARVKSFGAGVAGKIFVDKAPMSSIWQPMIAKLFPQARILLARRDPRDVVLSSFRHAFLVNALTAAFVDLTETAHFYGEVMALCESYLDRLRLPTHVHRHEAMVADFDGEIERVCRFLDIEYVPAMRDFAETAKRRDVRTPSAEQVRAGLNAKGVGYWRRYAKNMAPVLPVLEPWVEKFGYPPS